MIGRVAKILIGEYVDFLALAVILAGALCLVLATVLAYLALLPFATLFVIIGVLFILLGFIGGKVIDTLLNRAFR